MLTQDDSVAKNAKLGFLFASSISSGQQDEAVPCCQILKSSSFKNLH